MKAAVFHEVGKPLSIEEIGIPEPGPGELVVKVRNCGICGSDLHATEPGMFTLPAGTVMGHEFAGEVAAVGDGVGERFKVGDRVNSLPFILPETPPPGFEDAEAFMRPDVQSIGLGQVPGAYSEYVRVGVGQTHKLPDNVSFRQGALVEPLSVGLHGVNMSGMKAGDSVLVLGAGPIGLATTLFANFLGATHVVVSELSDQRKAMASEFGATHTVDAAGNVLEQFMAITGKMPDVIFEAVGRKGMIQQCIEMAPPKGRVTVLGVCPSEDVFMPGMAIVKEINLQFILGYQDAEWKFVLEMLAQGRIDVDKMITHTVGFEQLPDAFEALRKPSDQCKVMIELD